MERYVIKKPANGKNFDFEPNLCYSQVDFKSFHTLSGLVKLITKSLP